MAADRFEGGVRTLDGGLTFRQVTDYDTALRLLQAGLLWRTKGHGVVPTTQDEWPDTFPTPELDKAPYWWPNAATGDLFCVLEED